MPKLMFSRFQDELNKPYYLFRPGQLLSRLKRKLSRSRSASAYEQVILPWGLPFRVRPSDMIGAAVIRAGLYDLCVVEVLWRLLDHAETAVDAGANIGQMTSVMAVRVAGMGKVLSFEPHPQVFQELTSNVALWQTVPNMGRIQLYEMGLSKESGTASLHTTSEFVSNRGTASLEIDSDRGTKEGAAHSVSVGRLADVVDSGASIGVMKVDVEGHEISLLQGASPLLTERRIRDIVFEDHNSYPSPVTEYLEQAGYTIFSIQQGPLAVRVRPAKRNEARYKYEAQSYLATLNAPRAMERLSKLGYQSLQSSGNNGTVLPRIAASFILLLAVWFFVKNGEKKQ